MEYNMTTLITIKFNKIHNMLQRIWMSGRARWMQGRACWMNDGPGAPDAGQRPCSLDTRAHALDAGPRALLPGRARWMLGRARWMPADLYIDALGRHCRG